MVYSSNKENVSLPIMSLHFSHLCKQILPSTSYKGNWNKTKNSHHRTSMTVEHIISPVEFCFKTTYFQFQSRFFEQLQKTAIGSPINPIVANLYTKDFEMKAINTAEHPPRVWKRFVDDILVIIESSKKDRFLKHINNMDPHIKFTVE